MTPEYSDIKSRIAEEPTWYDDNGVPRYGAFHPRNAPNIYANEVALVEIGCQGCEKTWLVSFTHSSMDDVRAKIMGHEPMTLADAIKAGKLHYGDPPSHVETDHAGSTMNCIDWRVVEYWHMPSALHEWTRDPSLEIDLPDWADEEWADRRPQKSGET
jgi:hypothetical protein